VGKKHPLFFLFFTNLFKSKSTYFNMDFNKLFSFCFVDWLRNKSMQKLFAIVFFIYAVMNYFSIGLTYLFFKDLGEQTIQNVFIVINYTITLLALMIPFVLILTALTFLIIANGLRLEKKKSRKLDLITYIKFLFYSLVSGVVASFSLFNIKFLSIGLLGVLLFILGASFAFVSPPLAAILLMLGMLLLIGYGIIIVYNSLRLIVGQAIFVEREESILKSLKESWIQTKGNLWDIVVTVIVLIVIIMVLSFISQIPLIIYSIILSISAYFSQPANNIGVLLDPGYLILMLPTILVSAYSIIVGALLIVFLYTETEKKNEVRVEKKPIVKKKKQAKNKEKKQIKKKASKK
jgi:hypothetical protein